MDVAYQATTRASVPEFSNILEETVEVRPRIEGEDLSPMSQEEARETI